MTADQQTEYEAWLATRPESVRTIARQYPPGTKFLMHGKIMHAISFCENGTLCVTPTDPGADYQTAVAQRQPVCQCCVGNLDALRV